MQVKVSEASPFERTLEVTVDQKQVDTAYERAFGKAARRLALPGFRKGKVPVNLAKKYITDEGLSSDVVEDLVPQAYREALRQEKLQPISEPKWELVQRGRGKELIFKVSFEVKPVLEIKDYKGMAVKAERFDVTDQMVDEAIDEFRASQAKLVPVEDRPVQMGDVALVDYAGTMDGEPIEGGSAKDYLMEVKTENFIPGFVDNLVGMKAGEEKEFDITFPADYPATHLAGKEVHFKFNLHEVKEKQLPAVDDEFAKSVSQHETIDALRKDIRERLEANAERRVRERVAIKCIDKLLGQVAQESVPRSLHSWRTNVEIRRRLNEFSRMGVTLERYLADRKIDQQAWLQELAVMGMLESRVEVLLESIARAEGIDVSEEEMDQLFAVEAQNRGVSLAELHRSVDQEGSLPLIRYAVLRAKVMDFLFDNASITYVAPGESTDDEPAAEEKPAEEKSAAEKPAKKKSAKTAKETDAAEPAAAETGEGGGEAGEKPKAKRSTKKKAEEPAE